MISLSGLQELVEVRSASGDEGVMKEYLLKFIQKNQVEWNVKPKVVEGKGFQDALILVFGQPTTAVFVHMDSIGYMVAYDNELVRIGGPRTIDGTTLVGRDAIGEIEGELMLIEDPEEGNKLRILSDRIIERGTILTFKPNYRETPDFVQSPYMDNRLGLWIALELCKSAQNVAIVFSTYEEQGGGSVGFLGKYLIERLGIYQALICDITWVTEGIKAGEGVAISLHDRGIPRRFFIKKILAIAGQSNIPFQLEVESSGGSDGTMLQDSDLPFDWCFIGAAEQYVHSPDEKVHKKDIQAMLEIYQLLLSKL
jgi:putative aminopeptidase FrvX